MDDFLDCLLYSPTWITDGNDSSRSMWDDTVLSNANSLLSDPPQTLGSEKDSSIGMFPSSTTLGYESVENLNHHVDGDNSSIMVNRNLRPSKQQLYSQHSLPILTNNETRDGKLSLPGVIDGCMRSRSFESAVARKALPLSSSIESNESELSGFPQLLGDLNSITSVPTVWPASYSTISSIMEQGKLQDLGFHGNENKDNLLPHLDALPPASKHLQDSDEHKYSSFSSGQQLHLSTDIHPMEQTSLHLPSFPSVSQNPMNRPKTDYETILSPGAQSQATSANGNSGNGIVKPRVRARRGQATDPHSIAERLRREKISERMKNLRELLPNTNKTDKASMLDEIIDYVKFLQLQVKVLSMSRLGAAGAVVPLLTDHQTEGTGSLLLSSSLGQDGADVSDSEDNLAFEKEVLKLMETNITNAMQYLQKKGLCLMPIALTAAIPSQKGSSIAMLPERKRTEITNSLSGNNYVERNSTEVEANVRNADYLKQEVHH